MSRRVTGFIGHRIAPPKFLAFIATSLIAGWFLLPVLGPRFGVMAAFDLGALLFFALLAPVLVHKAGDMRETTRRNDANRLMLLVLTGMVTLAILAAIASELMDKGNGGAWALPMIVVTLVLSWTFSNMIYALHYAHIFYRKEEGGGDSGGLQFPETPEPDYGDFIYFAFCLGMTFQTSDVTVTSRRLRRVVTAHCLAAFVFNLGVLAFTINVLGGG